MCFDVMLSIKSLLQNYLTVVPLKTLFLFGSFNLPKHRKHVKVNGRPKFRNCFIDIVIVHNLILPSTKLRCRSRHYWIANRETPLYSKTGL